MKRYRVIGITLGVAALALVLMFGALASQSAKVEEVAAAAQEAATYSTSAITAETYTNEPFVAGLDEIDIFATADITPSATVALTVETSYDGTNWTNLLDSSGNAITLTLDADETLYKTVSTVAGLYMRVKMVPTDSVTMTVKGVGRRN